MQKVLNSIKQLFAPRQHYHTGADSPRLSYNDLDLGGSVAASKFTHNLVFSSTDADTVAWAAGTITFDNGQSYSIGAGNTGNMAARTYIYLDTVISVTALQVTTTATNAVGINKVSIAVAENIVGGKAIFQVFGGYGGLKASGADVYWSSGGATLDSLKPAEASADVTGSHSADVNVLLTQNAPVEAGADVTPSLPADSNLVAYFTLDEGTNQFANDSSLNGLVGIMNNMTEAAWVAGISGLCLDFDGTDDLMYVVDTTVIQNIFDGGGSISFWIYPHSDGEGDVGTVFNKGGIIQFYIWSELAGAVRCTFGQTFTGTDGDWTSSGRNITINAWNHVVITYNNSAATNEAIIYVNGSAITLSDAVPTGTRDTDAASDLYFGNRAAGDRAFDGLIDEIRIYDGILTAKQAQGLYKNPSGAKSIYPTVINRIDNMIIAQAAEAITAGKWVCARCKITDYTNVFEAQDYWQASPDDNDYGDADRLFLNKGGATQDIESVIKIITTSLPIGSNFLKGELYLYFNGIGSAQTVTISILTAAFNPATVTWNTKPANDTDSNTEFKYGTDYSFTVSGNGWQTIDITQLMRHWIGGNVTNYGIKLACDADSSCYIHRYDHANFKMYLRVTELNKNETKVYLADINSYATCRTIIGQALNTVSADGMVKIQTAGYLIGSYTDGQKVFLSTSGGELDGPNQEARAIKLCEVLTTTVKLIDIERDNILIEKLAVASLGGSTASYGTSYRFYVTKDARLAVINYKISTGGSDVLYGTLRIRPGLSEDTSETQQHYDNVIEVRDITAAWSNTNPPYITISRTDASVTILSIEEIYLYN